MFWEGMKVKYRVFSCGTSELSISMCIRFLFRKPLNKSNKVYLQIRSHPFTNLGRKLVSIPYLGYIVTKSFAIKFGFSDSGFENYVVL